MLQGHPKDHWDKNSKAIKVIMQKIKILIKQGCDAWDDSHIMIDLILVNEDTRVFGNEISIQDNVPCGTYCGENRREV